jgi:hypothetical protein
MSNLLSTPKGPIAIRPAVAEDAAAQRTPFVHCAKTGGITQCKARSHRQ